MYVCMYVHAITLKVAAGFWPNFQHLQLQYIRRVTKRLDFGCAAQRKNPHGAVRFLTGSVSHRLTYSNQFWHIHLIVIHLGEREVLWGRPRPTQGDRVPNFGDTAYVSLYIRNDIHRPGPNFARRLRRKYLCGSPRLLWLSRHAPSRVISTSFARVWS